MMSLLGFKFADVCIKLTLFHLFIALNFGITRSVAGADAATNTDDTDRIPVKIYIESLSSESYLFLKYQLKHTWPQLHPIMNLTIIPYGRATLRSPTGQESPAKAEEPQSNMTNMMERSDDVTVPSVSGDGDGTEEPTQAESPVVCPGGPDECTMTQFMLCGMNHFGNDPLKYVPFVICTMRRRNFFSAAICSSKAKIFHPDIIGCARGPEGQQLLLDAGERTRAFMDPVDNVPAIVINGERNKNAVTNFKQEICQAYQGTKELRGCRGITKPTKSLTMKPVIRC